MMCLVQCAASLQPALADTLINFSNINGRFQPAVAPGQTVEGTVLYLGAYDTADECGVRATGTDSPSQCYSYTHFAESYHNKSFARQCYCVVTKFVDWFPHRDLGATSARLWRGCAASVDCAYNGQCNTTSGACQCRPGWKGVACTRLDEKPTKYSAGYQPKPDGVNTSSWGGPILKDASGTYHMWPSQMLGHCGLDSWASNSQIMHATSETALGPYIFKEVLFDSFSHEADVKVAPDGTLLMAMTQRVPNTWRLCSCYNGSTPPTCLPFPAHPDLDPTTLSTATSFDGPWSTPVAVMHDTISDSNLTPLVTESGGLVGLYRTFYNTTLTTWYSRIHWVTASDWKDPATYAYNVTHGDLYHLGGPTEDPFLYRDKQTGVYHALFHNMYGCMPCGGHAFSADGEVWVYTGGDAYLDVLTFEDGVQHSVPRRERPHLVFSDSGELEFLSTGVVPGWNQDFSFTSVVPLQ
eukprot:TRINITY_DN27445_c0_g1_i1.p1 TRINITY_DN27445_c0_g1~~TRINITY_DN27445_c0_g1_i1.p1  ORF type:complete len:524 (+),score=121.16 TRINITY_DN27445_c0_g1_i1:173-1573(+)